MFVYVCISYTVSMIAHAETDNTEETSSVIVIHRAFYRMYRKSPSFTHYSSCSITFVHIPTSDEV